MHRVGTTAQGLVASTSCGPLRPASRWLSDHCGATAVKDKNNATHSLRGRRQTARQTQSALLDPPPFDPAKLTVRYLPGATDADGTAAVPWPRRYTLTHNDLTGSLQLSIGAEYNHRQLSGWYTRILRDEVLAEWHFPQGDLSDAETSANGDDVAPKLNVYCHVSGEELWPAPPALRSFIFQREMRLVLDTITYAERRLLVACPCLASAKVYVHLRSDMEALDRVVAWGSLGDRASWENRRAEGSLSELLSAFLLGAPLRQAEDDTDFAEPRLPVESFDGQVMNKRADILERKAVACGSGALQPQQMEYSGGVKPPPAPSSTFSAGSKVLRSLRGSGRPGSVAVAAQRVGESPWPLSNGGVTAESRPLVEAAMVDPQSASSSRPSSNT